MNSHSHRSSNSRHRQQPASPMSPCPSSPVITGAPLDGPADCTLACDEGHLTAHKIMLCAHSKYLQDILSRFPNAEHPIIILTELNITDIKILVNYMYTGELVITNDGSPSSLLRAAQILKIDSLTDFDDDDDQNNNQPDYQPSRQHQQYHNNNNSSNQDRDHHHHNNHSHQYNNNNNNNNNNSNHNHNHHLNTNNNNNKLESKYHAMHLDVSRSPSPTPSPSPPPHSHHHQQHHQTTMQLPPQQLAPPLPPQLIKSTLNHNSNHTSSTPVTRTRANNVKQSPPQRNNHQQQKQQQQQVSSPRHQPQSQQQQQQQITSLTKDSNNKIRCHLCKIGLSDVKCLYRHVLTRHLPQKWGYKCEFCDREFSRDDHLMRHYTTKHKNMEFNREKIRETRRLNREMAKNFHDEISKFNGLEGLEGLEGISEDISL